jgi:hypothetical protein
MTIKLKHVAAIFITMGLVQQTVMFDSPYNLRVQFKTAKFSQRQKRCKTAAQEY